MLTLVHVSRRPTATRCDGSRHAARVRSGVALCLTVGALAAAPVLLGAQRAPDRVLTRAGDVGPDGPLPADQGLPGLWYRLQKLRTTASVLYTAGHPDDEEAGVLTLLGRGMGVRTALLTLNRGEGGANAMGPELFDGLGLVRTEELRRSGRYYGLDDQYFTTAVDYGYSKTLDEAMRSWDRDALLADMVRVIRLNRPTVVISRWHGSARDGHGHHQAAGVLTVEAVRAAADPNRFREQVTNEGLRPWRVRRLYRGRLTDDESHDAELDPHRVDPWLQQTFQSFGAYGLSLQRSQTAGRIRAARPPLRPARYELVDAFDGAEIPERQGPEPAGATSSETRPSPFDGLDTSLSGVGLLTGETVPPEVLHSLEEAEAAVEDAFTAFGPSRLGSVARHVAGALAHLRAARRGLAADSEADFVLAVEERQAADALAAAAGLTVRAVATPPGLGPDTPTGPAVPGQSLDVHVTLSTWEGVDAGLVSLALESKAGWSGGSWTDGPVPVGRHRSVTLALRIPDDAGPSRPWFYRTDIGQNHYLVRDSSALHLGERPPDAVVVATLEVEGQRIEVREPARRIESNAPYGVLLRPLDIVPALSVSLAPRVALPRLDDGVFETRLVVRSNAPAGASATARLDLPTGWRSTPEAAELTFAVAGQTETVTFRVDTGEDLPEDGASRLVEARVRTGGRAYVDGYEVIAHRDLDSRRLWAPARLRVPAIDARAPDVRVGYVMGVGDDVPEAILQLGATVSLLDADALTRGDLTAYDAIVVGTRAYAVRQDLVASNARLLDFARDGGHLVILYQTPEYDPASQAPFPATLPPTAEEVSEEDAPVRLLAPDHPLLRRPYVIGPSDFDGWIEQRGSKFFETWDAAYTPLVETHDTGQDPQSGVWLTAPVGEGRFTYVALALHRQLPYGVPGAYRILANLLLAEH